MQNKIIIVFWIILLTPLLAYSNGDTPAEKIVETEPKTVQKIRRGSGYLLFELQPGHAGAYLQISRLVDRNPRNWTIIDLDGRDPGLILIPLVSGRYQVHRVNAPYYNLPYKLDVSDSPYWAFQIQAGRINYIGSLRIQSERSRSAVNVELLNRLAATLDQIEAQFANELELYPLVMGVNYKDPFLSELVRE
ncbi:hypothetical protein [Marinimicrobium sp. ABcell2]|uniref:hypothetical protein n=1 Tax=Marinimicrobium sp. ABcell2 TaxID=3069751 RepID=UPI0027B0D7FB|nr:hypothetical protein [Marinimicrobium sp. ABcell2]MDQ2077051.1 hypothetical protein [Marinimicrobium sp. ABcell2]